MFKVFYVMLLVLSGCTNANIGVTAGSGKELSALNIDTFEVQAVGLPVFLGPIVVSNFSVAMAERGYQPVSEKGDAIVSITYVQDDMSSVQDRDDFEERIDQGGDTQFMARLEVDLRYSNRAETISLGSLQRIHRVRPGDYMHTGRASIALLEGFRSMLRDTLKTE